MNEEQIKSLIEQLKAAGLEEEQIMDVFYETFQKGKMDRADLETLANAMGYELTDDFKEDSHKDPIEEAGAEGLGDLSKEDLEEAKEIGPDESKEEFEEKLEDMGDKVEDEIKVEDKEEEAPAEAEEAAPEMEEEEKEEVEEEKSEDEDKDEEKSEDEEWEEAQKLFKI